MLANRQLSVSVAVLIALALVLTGCGPKTGTIKTGELSFNVDMTAALDAGVAIESAKVTLTRGSTVREMSLTISGDSATGEINLPIGNWYALVRIFGAGGVALYSGAASFEILPGKTVEATVVLAPEPGSVSIHVTWDLPPAAPTGLTATASPGRVDLAWNANIEPDLREYYVYRATAADGPFVRLGAYPLSAASYSDSEVTGGTTYYYVVTARDNGYYESPRSSCVTATPGRVAGRFTISGRLVDTNGRAVPFTTVRLRQIAETGEVRGDNYWGISGWSDHRVFTDQDGRFVMYSVDDSPLNGTHRLQVAAYPYQLNRYLRRAAQNTPDLSTYSEALLEVNLVADPAGAIIIRLMDETGAPFSGEAECVLSAQDGSAHYGSMYVVFSDGEAIYGGCPAVTSARLTVNVNGYASAEFPVEVSLNQDTLVSGQLSRL